MIDLEFDRQHLWHPYTSMDQPLPVYPVIAAEGSELILENGTRLIDGMASWWCAIHGYNNPAINAAAIAQLNRMSHVMFGGLTHAPAIALGKLLVELTPDGLDKVFICDSGSVSVEVAIKMALQYWSKQGQPGKKRLLTIRKGYHGDTFAAMSVCDPVGGMHELFSGALMENIFTDAPISPFGTICQAADLTPLEALLSEHKDEIAAFILEPIVQATGRMFFYSADYLAQVRILCDKYNILLITDEIATGFGRTGRMFACEHANITPDILCLGKAMTGGYISLAATLCTTAVAQTISSEGGVMMHGPTFMGNPLACAIAVKSIELLVDSPWQNRISAIEGILASELAQCLESPVVQDVRVLGGIGVVELTEPVDLGAAQRFFVEHGVWIRPFGKLVYLMPPYIIEKEQLITLCKVIIEFTRQGSKG